MVSHNRCAAQKDRHPIRALTDFALEARVLARENYRFDAGVETAVLRRPAAGPPPS